MASGIHSTIRSLQTRLHLRWCPKWYEAFSDPQGGFYERLGKGFKPVATGQRRLVTQCRQLSIYSNAFLFNNNKLYIDLKSKFEHLLDHYRTPKTGLWVFSLDDQGKVADRTCDLYALTFVIFACSHFYRAFQDPRAQRTALEVLDLIDRKFRMPGLPGLAEAIDADGAPLPQVRRQNPHMHLLEACLFAHETWGDPAFAKMADEMVTLFQSYFYRLESGALLEFLTDDLSSPHAEKGNRLEPGHAFEWVWLLKKHAVMKGEDTMHDPVAHALLDWGNRHGWDETFGGIYDVVSPKGDVLADTKRIWPFCEGLKANALMLDTAPDRQAIKDRVADMVRVFNSSYMQERGFWTEWLNRDLSPAADYMPGTTPYHVYFGITETLAVLNRRGAAKSWAAGLDSAFYGLRRSLSGAFRGLRGIVRS